MIVGAISDIGLKRENNQDFLFASTDYDFPLFIVADGMGGHKAGDIASSMAVEGVLQFFEKNKHKLLEDEDIRYVIRQAINHVNDKIYLKSFELPECSGMGTTITLAYLNNSKVYLGQVGDSRAYLVRDDTIIQLTEDHTLVNELIKNGTITSSEAVNHPQKNMITRAVGTSSRIKLDIFINELLPKDILILCSDGLTNMIDEETILRVIKRYDIKDMKNICNVLVGLAKENGGKDNITVIGINMDNEVVK